MLTEEELGTAIGARLRAEVADIDVRPDLLGAVRRRRGRRSAATRAGLGAVAAAVVIAGVGATVATFPGGEASHRHAAQQRTAGPTIRLDGYLIATPKGTSVRKVGVGYLVGDLRTRFFVLFLERGRVVAREAQAIRQRGGKSVRLGDLTGWSTGGSKGGELLLRAQGMPGQEYLVIKSAGATNAQILSFLAGLDVSRMSAMHVSCRPGCG